MHTVIRLMIVSMLMSSGRVVVPGCEELRMDGSWGFVAVEVEEMMDWRAECSWAE